MHLEHSRSVDAAASYSGISIDRGRKYSGIVPMEVSKCNKKISLSSGSEKLE